MNPPSIRAIKAALETIPHALYDEPLPEDVSEGIKPAAEIARLDPHAVREETQAEYKTRDDNDENGVSDNPICIFEVPPEVTDQDVESKLGDELGRLRRLHHMKGTDALGWYVTFHQNAAQFGVHIPIEGIASLAIMALDAVELPIERKLEIAFYAILRHELFHFAADCMAANWELSLGYQVYWSANFNLRNERGYIKLEEALANAYMLRGLRHPIRTLRDSRGSASALKAFCGSQPEGYRDGPSYAVSRETYITGCRKLSTSFQHEGERDLERGDWQWYVPDTVLDTLIFYPDAIRIDWRRCPIIVYDRLGLLHSLGIGISFFEVISSIIETPAFLKALARLDSRIQNIWHRRKADLARSVRLKGLGFQQWQPGGTDCYSVNVDGNYRAHIRRDRQSQAWIAEAIGDHKSMGHG
jgi:hypothetical protein